MYPDSSLKLNYENESHLYFFTSPFEPFDHFSAHRIKLWGREFATAEHAFQWKKFDGAAPGVAAQILVASSPWAVKRLSKDNASLRRPDWDDVKVEVMEETLRAKVDQHQDVRDMLLSTGSKRIVENSPIDDFWGAGPDGDGQDHIGRILTEIRDEIKTAS